MNERDEIRMRHMLDEARRALEFMKNRSRSDLDDDEMLAYAVVRALEIIGEAASKVTVETREQYPQIAWRQTVGMRNRIIHGYDNVSLDIVWGTILDDLPPLVSQLEDVLS